MVLQQWLPTSLLQSPRQVYQQAMVVKASPHRVLDGVPAGQVISSVLEESRLAQILLDLCNTGWLSILEAINAVNCTNITRAAEVHAWQHRCMQPPRFRALSHRCMQHSRAGSF
jgi:hypothetical protein